METIYLDNSATTKPYREVTTLMARVQGEIYGNPSSLHDMGLEAEGVIKTARRQVAALFYGREKEIIFTAGGTEANNLAVRGAAYRHRRRGSHIITTEIEHSSVLKCCRALEQEGFRVSYLPVDSSGYIDPGQLKETLCSDTILVSVIHVSNEIGTVQPLEEIGSIIKTANSDTLFHLDAVQSFARLPLELKRWRADLVSCSAHKIHGPKGAGCLWVRSGTLLQPLMQGGEQESALRPGTENSPALAGFGLAAELAESGLRDKTARVRALKELFYRKLQEQNAKFIINGPPPEEAAPHILNLSFPGLKAEVLLNSLSDKGVYVSAGSACHSRRPEPSHVLQAIGLGKTMAGSALRFSFSILNSETEIISGAAATASAARQLQDIMSG